ncbi:hypothetical protein HOY82DRAFT_542137 [Tuber indicum]|nr:hypothetical protein HOY82DRAFT_542137 [Tuber indicum]
MLTTTLSSLPFRTAHAFGLRGATTTSSTFFFLLSLTTTFQPAFLSSSILYTLNISPLTCTSTIFSSSINSIFIDACCATPPTTSSAISSTLATNTATAPKDTATTNSDTTASSGGATGVGTTPKPPPLSPLSPSSTVSHPLPQTGVTYGASSITCLHDAEASQSPSAAHPTST